MEANRYKQCWLRYVKNRFQKKKVLQFFAVIHLTLVLALILDLSEIITGRSKFLLEQSYFRGRKKTVSSTVFSVHKYK